MAAGRATIYRRAQKLPTSSAQRALRHSRVMELPGERNAMCIQQHTTQPRSPRSVRHAGVFPTIVIDKHELLEPIRCHTGQIGLSSASRRALRSHVAHFHGADRVPNARLRESMNDSGPELEGKDGPPGVPPRREQLHSDRVVISPPGCTQLHRPIHLERPMRVSTGGGGAGTVQRLAPRCHPVPSTQRGAFTLGAWIENGGSRRGALPHDDAHAERRSFPGFPRTRAPRLTTRRTWKCPHHRARRNPTPMRPDYHRRISMSTDVCLITSSDRPTPPDAQSATTRSPIADTPFRTQPLR